MTKDEFVSLQLQHQQSGKILKRFLKEAGICYSRYHYWDKKYKSDEVPQELAPIMFMEARVKDPASATFANDMPSGTTLLFPNGLRAHFGTGTEGILMEIQDKKDAGYALSRIGLLYQIEKECDSREISSPERKQMRMLKARPIMEELKGWFEQMAVKYGSSTLIGKAAGYAYARWDSMMRYLEDGRIRIDNNLAENEIRPITLGRKNDLFCGNHEAAENMCIIVSLLSTCRNHGVNPREYLSDIIARMPYMEKASHDRLVELLPHRWKLHQTQPMTNR